MGEAFETVIGLEVHVELSTKTKLFCGCSAAFGAAPNTQICPVCTGMPGALPVLNKKVLESAIAAGLATHCSIAPAAVFDRKNYFYPDNPQNYQITQFYHPICTDGWLEIPEGDGGTKRIRIHEIHIEDDAGKLDHTAGDDRSLVDYNRSGVPLLEIVSEPDMRTAEEAAAYLEHLRMTLKYLGISDCKMQEGSMRADVNLSVRPQGSDVLGVRTEMKNLNSFRAVRAAVESEKKRQIECIQRGEAVLRETRRWDDQAGASFSMRGKEELQDYRYFPEPDLLPVEVPGGLVEKVRASLPELRGQKQSRFMEQYKLPEHDARILTQDRALADFFEKTTALCGEPKKVSNRLMTDGLRLMRKEGIEASELRFSPEHLASLVKLSADGSINSTIASEVFEKLFYEDFDPKRYVTENDLLQRIDENALSGAVEKVLGENPKAVEDYRAGKQKAVGFLVGQMMKETGGSAPPDLVRKALIKRLSKEE